MFKRVVGSNVLKYNNEYNDDDDDGDELVALRMCLCVCVCRFGATR